MPFPHIQTQVQQAHHRPGWGVAAARSAVRACPNFFLIFPHSRFANGILCSYNMQTHVARIMTRPLLSLPYTLLIQLQAFPLVTLQYLTIWLSFCFFSLPRALRFPPRSYIHCVPARSIVTTTLPSSSDRNPLPFLYNGCRFMSQLNMLP